MNFIYLLSQVGHFSNLLGVEDYDGCNNNVILMQYTADNVKI